LPVSALGTIHEYRSAGFAWAGFGLQSANASYGGARRNRQAAYGAVRLVRQVRASPSDPSDMTLTAAVIQVIAEPANPLAMGAR